MKICRDIARRAALTLLEMMVAITLLAVIMLGLVMMFNQTQKALQIANAQTDVFENTRTAIEMIARDLHEMSRFVDTNVMNAYAVAWQSPVPGGFLPLPQPPPNDRAYVDFTEAFWLKKVNDDWQGIGYFVAENPGPSGTRVNTGVGTLYRYYNTARKDFAPWLATDYKTNEQAYHRISDGVVHFSMSAVYVTNTSLDATNIILDYVPAGSFTLTNELPAFVDVEVGVLEPTLLKQFRSLNDFDTNAAQSFLTNHAGKVHFFRERVPIRNFVNPYRLNEVP